MKYIFLLIFSLIGIKNNVYCQKDSLQLNSIFIEINDLESPCLFINYDRKIPLNNKIGLNTCLGFTFHTEIGNDTLSPFKSYRFVDYYSFPIQIKFYYQFRKHTFLFGGNIGYIMGRPFMFRPFIKGIQIYGGIGYSYSMLNNLCYIGLSFNPIYWNSFERNIKFYAVDALRLGFKF